MFADPVLASDHNDNIIPTSDYSKSLETLITKDINTKPTYKPDDMNNSTHPESGDKFYIQKEVEGMTNVADVDKPTNINVVDNQNE